MLLIQAAAANPANLKRPQQAMKLLARLLLLLLPLAAQAEPAVRVYDLNGNLVSQSDFNGNVTSYSYDARDRRIRKSLPGGAFETNGYDGAGGLTSHQDANGNRFVHSLDIRGERTQTVATPVSANSAGSITQSVYSYDANGNRTSVSQSDSDGTRTETTSYDAFNRPVKITDAWGNSLTHSYDAQGNRTSTNASPGGNITSYSYDALNRRTSQSGASGASQISYDRSGKITQILYPDGSSLSTSYDAAGRVSSEVSSTSAVAGADNTIQSVTYSYDANGNRIGSQSASALSAGNRSAALSASLNGGSDPYSRSRVESWSYDRQDRLTSHSSPESTTIWTLDAGGRRIQQSVSSVGASPPSGHPLEASAQPEGVLNYSYNQRDQLIQISGAQTISYSYDANGNRLSQSSSQGASTVTISYHWNAQDQLVSVEQDSGHGAQWVASYRYNADNLRAEKQLGDAGLSNASQGSAGANSPIVYERIQWDGLHARRSYEIGAGDSQTLRSDTDAAELKPDGAPLLFNRTSYSNGVGSASSSSQLHQDSNGNLIATVSDATGTAKADSLLQYTAYGLINTQASGNAGTVLRSNGDTFGSYYADPETGLLYARARYYDPSSGQFISRDPVEGQERLPITWAGYQYGRYNPYSFNDPSGQMAEIEEVRDGFRAASADLGVRANETTGTGDLLLNIVQRGSLDVLSLSLAAVNVAADTTVLIGRKTGYWSDDRVYESSDSLGQSTAATKNIYDYFRHKDGLWKTYDATVDNTSRWMSGDRQAASNMGAFFTSMLAMSAVSEANQGAQLVEQGAGRLGSGVMQTRVATRALVEALDGPVQPATARQVTGAAAKELPVVSAQATSEGTDLGTKFVDWSFKQTAPVVPSVPNYGSFSAYGEIRVNGVVPQYDVIPSVETPGPASVARMGYSAAQGAVRKNFDVYEILSEQPISGSTRGPHRVSANRGLYRDLQSDPALAHIFDTELNADVLGHMSSGSKLLNPPGTVWHHPVENPNVMRLLRLTEHTNPLMQQALHPEGIGGFGTYYGK